jgi:hypothetical protein
VKYNIIIVSTIIVHFDSQYTPVAIMPVITIDLPDNLNVPSNWDARLFFVAKMYEAGFLSSDQAAQVIGVAPPQFFETVKDYFKKPAAQ